MFIAPRKLYVKWDAPCKHGYYLDARRDNPTMDHTTLVHGPAPKNYTGRVVWVCFDKSNGDAWEPGEGGYVWVDLTRREARSRYIKHRNSLYDYSRRPLAQLSPPVQYFLQYA